VIRVNFNDQASRLCQRHRCELTLHGQQGSDATRSFAGQISSRINVFDQSRAMRASTGCALRHNQVDYFLLRANKEAGIGMVAAVEVDANRVRWRRRDRAHQLRCDISGAVEIFGRDGDDTFVLDDNLARRRSSAMPGRHFQIGQVFQSFRTPQSRQRPGEEDTTKPPRSPWLPVERCQRQTCCSAYRQRQLHVYSNKPNCSSSRRDDDTFTVRAFVKVDPNDPKAPYTNINGARAPTSSPSRQCASAHRRRRRFDTLT